MSGHRRGLVVDDGVEGLGDREELVRMLHMVRALGGVDGAVKYAINDVTNHTGFRLVCRREGRGRELHTHDLNHHC